MKKLPIVVCLAAFAGSGHAQVPVPARDAAASCRSCHAQPHAVGGSIPALEALSRKDIVDRMRDFRAGKRAGTVMPQLARGYTDAQIDMIATALAASAR